MRPRVLLITDKEQFIGDLESADIESGTWRLLNASQFDEEGRERPRCKVISGRFMRFFAVVDSDPEAP